MGDEKGEKEGRTYKNFRRVKDEDRFFTCETENTRSRH